MTSAAQSKSFKDRLLQEAKRDRDRAETLPPGAYRRMQFRHLAEAERHIALGTQHISKQELCIADLELHGHNSTLARSLLETFRRIQVEHVAHRDQILRELGQ